ncbi:phage holin family protein [Paraburkholderia sp. Ac-20340]|uniref:phage holin family protein n=1 Tax=Paraburkholderia sp. Ac-20340 TaxID=2703888 RepID=UPI00197E2B41|nr:phage holin family protein [Paraburkholderia sp. Ac-20340]MBN3852154.1 phage holin family protein [Paraburkholderia sp. Ac-20340]
MSMQAKLDRWRNVSRFLIARMTDYGELFMIELAETRARIMREMLALVALAVTLLFTLSFFCFALIASAWNTAYFLAVVWGIAAAWLLLSLAALLIFRAQRHAQSFGVLRDELRADVETVKEALK